MFEHFISGIVHRIESGSWAFPKSAKVIPYAYTFVSLAILLNIVGILYDFYFHKNTTAPYTISATWSPAVKNISYRAIIQRNIFNIDGTIPDISNEFSHCPAEVPQSSLAYKVTGIIYAGTAATSLVLLAESADEQSETYKIGDKLPNGAIVSDISKNKIFLTMKSCPEFLAIQYPIISASRSSKDNNAPAGSSYSEDGFERSGNDTLVTKQWINHLMTSNFASTLEAAKATPNMVNGQIKGFTLTQILPDSVYSKLGLKDGDTVASINGIDLNDAAKAIQTLNTMRSANAINLQVMRGGQPVALKINIQ